VLPANIPSSATPIAIARSIAPPENDEPDVRIDTIGQSYRLSARTTVRRHSQFPDKGFPRSAKRRTIGGSAGRNEDGATSGNIARRMAVIRTDRRLLRYA
jgi:hypothetical protein